MGAPSKCSNSSGPAMESGEIPSQTASERVSATLGVRVKKLEEDQGEEANPGFPVGAAG